MSYDLMVFEITKAPKTKKDLMTWYALQIDCGEDHDYAAFAWPLAEEAYKLSRDLAKKHGVGFFDASEDGSGIKDRRTKKPSDVRVRLVF